jgi:hypothetical protein
LLKYECNASIFNLSIRQHLYWNTDCSKDMVERIYVSDRNAPEDEPSDEYLILDLINDLFSGEHDKVEWSAYLLASHFTPPLPERIPELSEALKFNLEREPVLPSMSFPVVNNITKCLVRSLEVSPNQDALDALIQALGSNAAPLAARGISFIPNNSAVDPLIDTIENQKWEEYWIECDFKFHKNQRILNENPYPATEILVHLEPLTVNVIKTLGIIGEPKAIDILTKFTNHELDEISKEAKKSIERIIESSK